MLQRLEDQAYAAASAAGRRVAGRRGASRRGAGTTATRGADGDGSRATAEITLGGHNHVIVRSKVQANLSPRVEMVASGDGSAGTLALSNAPVLLECPGAFDGGSIGSSADVDIVGAAVARHRTLPRSTRAGVVGAEVFHDIILENMSDFIPVDKLRIGLPRSRGF